MLQPMPAPDEYERTDSRALRVDEVQAQWLQNIGAGVGTATITVLLAWGIGADLAMHWRWPLILGGCVFGAGQVVRAFVDEFRAERRWRRRENEHRIEMETIVALSDRLEEERDALRNERDALRADLHNVENQLRSERYLSAQARKPATPKHGGPLIDMYPQATRDDAKLLISRWYATGKWPGERTMQWPRERHTDARQLLERAEILVMGGKVGATPPDAPPNNEAWALATLAAAFGVAPE